MSLLHQLLYFYYPESKVCIENKVHSGAKWKEQKQIIRIWKFQIWQRRQGRSEWNGEKIGLKSYFLLGKIK